MIVVKMLEIILHLKDEHPMVAETAIVGIPHDIKGEGTFM